MEEEFKLNIKTDLRMCFAHPPAQLIVETKTKKRN